MPLLSQRFSVWILALYFFCNSAWSHGCEIPFYTLSDLLSQNRPFGHYLITEEGLTTFLKSNFKYNRLEKNKFGTDNGNITQLHFSQNSNHKALTINTRVLAEFFKLDQHLRNANFQQLWEDFRSSNQNSPRLQAKFNRKELHSFSTPYTRWIQNQISREMSGKYFVQGSVITDLTFLHKNKKFDMTRIRIPHAFNNLLRIFNRTNNKDYFIENNLIFPHGQQVINFREPNHIFVTQRQQELIPEINFKGKNTFLSLHETQSLSRIELYLNKDSVSGDHPSLGFESYTYNFLPPLFPNDAFPIKKKLEIKIEQKKGSLAKNKQTVAQVTFTYNIYHRGIPVDTFEASSKWLSKEELDTYLKKPYDQILSNQNTAWKTMDSLYSYLVTNKFPFAQIQLTKHSTNHNGFETTLLRNHARVAVQTVQQNPMTTTFNFKTKTYTAKYHRKSEDSHTFFIHYFSPFGMTPISTYALTDHPSKIISLYGDDHLSKVQMLSLVKQNLWKHFPRKDTAFRSTTLANQIVGSESWTYSD